MSERKFQEKASKVDDTNLWIPRPLQPRKQHVSHPHAIILVLEEEVQHSPQQAAFRGAAQQQLQVGCRRRLLGRATLQRPRFRLPIVLR